MTLLLIGAGDGCDARFNGEPVSEEFNERMRMLDRERWHQLWRAREAWGIIDRRKETNA